MHKIILKKGAVYMPMLTINELSKKTGISAYEIRRRVLAGSCPHMRVGAKKTKILINYNLFTEMIKEENFKNMQTQNNIAQIADDINGYDMIKQIN